MPVAVPLAPYLELPECIAALLLLLSLLQGMIRRLADLRGLQWLPMLSMLILIALFPAYGFRLEAVPLLLYSVVFSAARAAGMLSRRGGFFDDDTADRGVFLNTLFLLLLAAAVFPALFFAPLERDAVQARHVTVRDEETGVTYTVNVYGEDGEDGAAAKKPVILVIPPDLGGTAAVERVCGELAGKGFAAAAASRQARHSPARLFRYWRLVRRGAVYWKDNQAGRALETERRRDIAFLLPRLKALCPAADTDNLFIAGWNAGGAAAVYAAAPPDAAVPPGLKGIVAVESLFYSAWTGETRQADVPPDGAPALLRFRTALRACLAGLKPLRTAAVGDVPVPAVPVLYLAGDRLEAGGRRWEALQKTAAAAKHGAVLAVVEGAGPLDYSGVPVDKPLYPLLLRGLGRRVWTGRSCPANTAALIAAFAADILRGNAAVQTSVPTAAAGVKILAP